MPSLDVFFYGLFMDAEALRARGFHPSDERRACVKGMALKLGPRATLVEDSSRSAYGFVMRMPSDELTQLYADPVLADYRPEAVLAECKNAQNIMALCYILRSEPSYAAKNSEYASMLRGLGLRLGLPASYVEQIR